MRLIFEEYLSLNAGAWNLGSLYALDGGLWSVVGREASVLAVCGDFYNCLLLRHLNVESAVWALTSKHNSVAVLVLADAASA
jgi:hypothetical protein